MVLFTLHWFLTELIIIRPTKQAVFDYNADLLSRTISRWKFDIAATGYILPIIDRLQAEPQVKLLQSIFNK